MSVATPGEENKTSPTTPKMEIIADPLKKVVHSCRVMLFEISHPHVQLGVLSQEWLEKVINMEVGGHVKVLSGENGDIRVATVDSRLVPKIMKIIKLDDFEDIAVRMLPEIRACQGMIKGLPGYFSKVELERLLESQGVISVRILRRTRGSPRQSVAATFNSEKLPKSITLVKKLYKVWKFSNDEAIQCTNCLMFGHFDFMFCTPKHKRCVLCGKSHIPWVCDGMIWCANCAGPHSAMSKYCPLRNAAKDAKFICNFEDIPYRQALVKASCEQGLKLLRIKSKESD